MGFVYKKNDEYHQTYSLKTVKGSVKTKTKLNDIQKSLHGCRIVNLISLLIIFWKKIKGFRLSVADSMVRKHKS